jgi:hypothetical protein
MEAMGLAPGASPGRLRFAASPEDAVEGAQFVQENGPERLDLKRDLFRRLDEAAPADAVLATSSSTITVSEIQDACARHPERVVLGHPFNPPHLIPLVEVAGGRATSAGVGGAALGFYRALGKHPSTSAGRCAATSPTAASGAVAGGVPPGRQPASPAWRTWTPRSRTARPALGAARAVPQPAPVRRPGRHRRAVREAALAGDRGHVARPRLVSVDAELGRRVADGVAEELAARGGREEVVRRRDEAMLALLRLKAGEAPR